MGLDSLYKCMRQGLNIVPIQVGGGLIQGQNPTVETEGFSQCQTDDQGGQNLHVHVKIQKHAFASDRTPQKPLTSTF